MSIPPIVVKGRSSRPPLFIHLPVSLFSVFQQVVDSRPTNIEAVLQIYQFASLSSERFKNFVTNVAMTLAVSLSSYIHSTQVLNSTQAIGQLCSTASMSHNLALCQILVKKAVEAGAKVRPFPHSTTLLRNRPS